MKPVALCLVAAAALAGHCGVEAFRLRAAQAPRMSSTAAAPKAAATGADKKSEEPLLLRAAKGEVRASCVGGSIVVLGYGGVGSGTPPHFGPATCTNGPASLQSAQRARPLP